MTTVLDEASMNEALLQVCEAFGYTSLLPMQEKAIRGMVIGRDVFVMLPTGSGRSSCYTVLVVSPLEVILRAIARSAHAS